MLRVYVVGIVCGGFLLALILDPLVDATRLPKRWKVALSVSIVIGYALFGAWIWQH
jgi:hypothetical protein